MAKSPKISPLNDRVVIRRLDVDEEVKGGIIIPDTAKEKPQKGEIVATGPGKVGDENKRVALEVKVGDNVLFGKYSGTEVSVDDEELLIMREDDILAIIG
jgi:chaperonin GroES